MDSSAPSEMDIVDAFTRVIFYGGEGLSPEEETILRTLCLVDKEAANAAAGTFPGDVGNYLKALEVTEMIQLVARVKDYYLPAESGPAKKRSRAGEHQPVRF